MPNHVRNRLIIKADEAKTNEITDFLMGKSDEDGMPCPIDFNKIVPMPESLMIESGSRGEMGEVILNKKGFYAGKEYPEVKKMFEELSAEQQQESLKIARLYRSNRKNTAMPLGTAGAARIGARNGMPTIRKKRRPTKYGSTPLGLV